MEFTAAQIAAFVGGAIDGDGNVRITNFAKIEEAGPSDLTFLANPKYTHFIYSTDAGAVLVHADFEVEHPVKATLIRVADPYSTLSQLMTVAAQAMAPQPVGVEEPSHVAEGVEVPEDAYIGAFAYVGKGVTLGKGVKIYPQAYVGDGCVIGDGTVLYPGVKVYHGCRIGARCVLHSGAVIGADGFGFAPDAEGRYHKIPQLGIVVIEDDVEVGANTTIDRATMGQTVVGRGTKLDNLIQLAHNTTVGEDTVMAAQVGVAGSTQIGSHCMVGGQVGFAGHIHVGDNVQIGAQSGIAHGVESNQRIMGSPAVDARQFMRQAALINRLPQFADQLRELSRSAKSDKTN